jgi:hypothetical protein
MTMGLLDALAPLPDSAPLGSSNFPYPNLVQSSGPGRPSYTFEGPKINGLNMPGQWLLKPVARVFEWQKVQANFMSGAYLRPTGLPLATIEYEVRIWESGTAGVYRQLLGTLFKKAVTVVPGAGAIQGTASSAALGIDDPSLKDLGITQVVVESVTNLVNPLVTSGGKGPWTASVVLIEYRPPAFKLPPVPDQTIPDNGALTPASFNALQTANAAMTAGATELQNRTAQQLFAGGGVT